MRMLSVLALIALWGMGFPTHQAQASQILTAKEIHYNIFEFSNKRGVKPRWSSARKLGSRRSRKSARYRRGSYRK